MSHNTGKQNAMVKYATGGKPKPINMIGPTVRWENQSPRFQGDTSQIFLSPCWKAKKYFLLIFLP